MPRHARTLCALLLLVAVAAFSHTARAGDGHGHKLGDPITIAGVVVDSTGAPVAGAHVTIPLHDIGVATDLDGHFHLHHVPSHPSPAVLKISAVGHETLLLEQDVCCGNVSGLTISLAADAVALDEVTLEVERARSGAVADGSERVEVLTANELEQRSTDGGLLSALDGGAGLDTKPCALCGSAGVGMQGLDPSYTEINVDGLPVLSGLGALYGLDGIAVSGLEEVRIQKGGGGNSGAGAMAGSVSLVSAVPDGPLHTLPRGRISAMGGETGRHRLAGELSLPVGDQPLTASAAYAAEPRKIDRNNDGLTDTPSYTRVNLGLRGQRAVTGGTLTVRVRGYVEERFAGETHWTEADRGSETVYGRDIRTRRLDTGLRYEADTRDWGAWSADAAFVRHTQDSWYGSTSYDAVQTIGIARLAFSRVWDSEHNTLLRGQYRHEGYDDNLTLGSETDRIDRVPGLLVQHEWDGGGPWMARASVLNEVYAGDGYVATPRASLRFQPADAWTFLAAGGAGYRTVTLFSLDKAAHAGFDNILLPADLEAERSVGGTLTAQWRAGSDVVAVDADLTGFYTRFQHKVIVAYGHAGHGEVVYANADDAFSRGVEAQLGFAFPAAWTLRLQGTINDIQYQDGAGVWRREEMRSAYTGGAMLEKAWESAGLTATGELSVFGPQELPEGRGRDQSPTYTIVDLGLRKSWGRYSVALRGENLTDYVQPDEVFVTDPVTGQRRLDAAMIYGPQLGRTLRLTVSAMFGG